MALALSDGLSGLRELNVMHDPGAAKAGALLAERFPRVIGVDPA